MNEPKKNRKLAKQIDQHLAERITKPTSIKYLCRVFKLNRRALLHIFVERYDRSPIEAARAYRLRAARKMIQTGDVFVQDAARKYGFRRAPDFTNYYKDEFGELPSVTLRRAKR
ncbi:MULTISPECIES: helix-turn-helix domain-containing protein [Bradyrhizobium]|uniref:helix-turn-helix domain-containing protein n=1 Tax=Bradyrhizobium TaxID=374 RepID=UPI000414480D|nr:MULTISPECIES: helix-turn-helix domain-containing protein [Bradyrhizobium]WLB85888.1 helix-turn-helix domain-containing protein [Bradyrhizobium japonicum USDA 135]